MNELLRHPTVVPLRVTGNYARGTYERYRVPAMHTRS